MAYSREIDKLERRWKENPQGTTFAPYAEALRKSGDLERAQEVLREGLGVHPDHIPGNIVLGRCALDSQDDAAAETAFTHVLELDGENVIALKALADITERQGRLDDAHRWLTLLISVDPSNDEAREQLERADSARDQQASFAAKAAAEMAPAEPVTEVPQGRVLSDDQMDTAVVPAQRASEPRYPPAAAVEAAPPEPEPEPEQEPFEPSPPPGLGFNPDEIETVPMMSAFRPPRSEDPPPPRYYEAAPEPLPDFQPGELDLAAESPEPQVVPGMVLDDDGPALDTPLELEPAEPLISPPATGQMDMGVEQAEDIVLMSSGSSTEFQTPSDADELLRSEGGSSEFQTPDASSEMMGLKGSGDEYQRPTGAENLGAAYYPPPPPDEPPVELGAEVGMGWSPPEPMERFEPAPAFEPPGPVFEPPAPVELISTPEAPPPVPEIDPLPAELAMPDLAVTADLPLIFPDDEAAPPPRRRISAPIDEVTPALAGAEVAAENEGLETPVGEPEPIVTESMAEVYVRQGLVVEALRVYRELAGRSPRDDRLRLKVEELARIAEGRESAPQRWPAYAATLSGGESVESFFHALVAAPLNPVAGGGAAAEAGSDESRAGAPTRPAEDPLSLSAIFGEDGAPAATAPPAEPAAPGSGDSGFSFDQFFAGRSGGPGGGSGAGGPSVRGGSGPEEDLDQFQNWLKSLKR